MKTAYDVGEAMSKAPQHPMSKDMTTVFINLLMMQQAKIEIPDELKASFNYRLVDQRCVAFGVEADDYAKALVAMIADRPGTAVMYCAALHYVHKKTGKPATMQTLIDAFPMGFPNEEDLRIIWTSQKIDEEETGLMTDNWLDVKAAWDIPEEKEQAHG